MLLSWHIAETREKAIAEAREGLLRHHNEYIVGTLQRPGATPFKDHRRGDREDRLFGTGAAATIGTPDDLVAKHQVGRSRSAAASAPWSASSTTGPTRKTPSRSWDMVARYVVPEINGYLAKLRELREFVATNRDVFDRAKEAIMAKINENEAAVAALARHPRLAARRRRLGQQRARPRQGPRPSRGGVSQSGCIVS